MNIVTILGWAMFVANVVWFIAQTIHRKSLDKYHAMLTGWHASLLGLSKALKKVDDDPYDGLFDGSWREEVSR